MFHVRCPVRCPGKACGRVAFGCPLLLRCSGGRAPLTFSGLSVSFEICLFTHTGTWTTQGLKTLQRSKTIIFSIKPWKIKSLVAKLSYVLKELSFIVMADYAKASFFHSSCPCRCLAYMCRTTALLGQRAHAPLLWGLTSWSREGMRFCWSSSPAAHTDVSLVSPLWGGLPWRIK